MKNVFYYIVALMILVSCGQEEKPIDNINTSKAYYIGQKHNGRIQTDTLDFNDIKKIDLNDSIIGTYEFALNEQEYIISMFSNGHRADIDGGVIYYELKDLGIIYSRSTSWFSYKRLKTDNDSINNIIEIAIDHIILVPDLSPLVEIGKIE